MHRGDSCCLTQPERLEDGIRIKMFNCHRRLLDKHPCDRKARCAMINQKNVDKLRCLCRTKQERSQSKWTVGFVPHVAPNLLKVRHRPLNALFVRTNASISGMKDKNGPPSHLCRQAVFIMYLRNTNLISPASVPNPPSLSGSGPCWFRPIKGKYSWVAFGILTTTS